MGYKHGTYGESEASNFKSDVSIGTLPVYIGAMPIHRINVDGADGFSYKDYINKPILISSYRELSKLGLYSDDWKTYTLCEAMKAHFMNGDSSVGPIVLINMLDPTADIAGEATTATVSVSKEGTSYVGYVEDAKCCVDELTITADGVEFAEGEVAYGYDGDAVVISIKKEGFNAASVTASYKKINFTASEVSATDFGKAVDAVDDVEAMTGKIPTILAAPGFSQIPANHDLMVQKAVDRAAQKWNLICVTDIPCDSTANTFELAKAWKKTNQYNSKYEKACWPLVGLGNEIYHLSTDAVVAMQYIDTQNDDIPFVSASNKVIAADRALLADGTTIFIKEHEANDLNKVGITTVNLVKQTLRLWGPHMANYDFSKITSIKPEDRFDIQIRMLGYVLNYLQYNYLDEVDTTFKRSDIDSITNSVQTWLDSLVNAGALLYAAVDFSDEENTVEDLEDGNLTFALSLTYGILAKSLTFKVRYTRDGIVTLLEGSEE